MIDSVLTAVNSFYVDVLESLLPSAAAPPKLRPAHPTPPDIDESIPADLSSTDYSSQDDVDDVDDVPMVEDSEPVGAESGQPAYDPAEEGLAPEPLAAER